MKDETLQGALTFLGFIISVLAVFYFAIEFIPRVGDWSQLAALVLLAGCFGFLAAFLKQTVIGGPFFDALPWLHPPGVMVLLAIIAGVTAEIRFLAIDVLSREVKILVSLVLGIGIILAVAMTRRAPATSE